MRIQQLTAAVANQIAAGEVIERPASIVKELLENSLDAKSTAISIDIGHGGLNQVKISDNGLGIVAEDLPLAIAAHATSKITQLTDLYAITSMGFRGEALASIASVARVTISSKPALQANGMMLENLKGEIKLLPCARTTGTTIDVRDIFYNAPVRKKFLKSDRMEFQAIEHVVKRFALSAPDVAITLTHNGKVHLNLPAATDEGSKLTRMVKLLGKQFIDQSLALDVSHAGMRMQGWLSNLDYQRSQNDKLWVYLNGRMLKDKLINHAIKQAYEDLLYPGRFPSCLLYLTMNPAEVDVNVHPTKHEVRFQQPRFVHDFIRSQLQARLGATETKQESESMIETPIQLPTRGIAEIGFEPFAAKSSLPLQLKEASTAPEFDYQPRTIHVSKEKGQHLVLNEQFAIMIIQQQPYLVDRLALQKHHLVTDLRQSELPLATRPLLVPLSMEVTESTEGLQPFLAALEQVGIQVSWAEEGRITIKTMPLCLPNLSLKTFVQAYFEASSQQPLSMEQIFELLASHQSWDGLTLSSEEEAQCRQAIHQEPLNGSFAKRLSLTLCRDLFNA
jgi:DNA mismatch repair protein MutL